MALKLTGRAHIAGLAGAATYSGFPATASWSPQSVNVSDDYEVKNILYDPSTAEPISFAFGREVRDLTLEIITISVTTHTVANAAGGDVFPTKPIKVTLSGFADADMNGDWIYLGGGKKTFSNDAAAAKLTLPLRQYKGVDAGALTALLATVT